MRLLFIAITAAVAISGCSGAQSPIASTSGGASVLPSHRAKPDVTSITAAVQNTYNASIGLVSTGGACLSASPPSSVPANSTSASFTISYIPTCIGTPSYSMTYGPAIIGTGNNCTFNVTFTAPNGPFAYSVTNQAHTACSYSVTGITPLDVVFVYAHS